MKKIKPKALLIGGSTFLTLIIICLGLWMLHLNHIIHERISKGWFLPPVEIYSSSQPLLAGEHISRDKLVASLKSRSYRQRSPDQKIYAGDFAVWPTSQCAAAVGSDWPAPSSDCLVFRQFSHAYSPQREAQIHLVAFAGDGTITGVFSGQPFVKAEGIELPPHLFAQFYGGKPILRDVITVGDVPLYCLQATTAIEDSRFLEHDGVSILGILRAIVRNIKQGRWAEGGSTITQQLVKNYFLTSRKTLRRKITEMFMAVLLEAQIPKDKILENYLNVIYMGQNGPFEVRGFGAASQHYFNESLGDLSLPQCALLAAIINNPGRYNPFTHPEKARQRRNLVLERMLDLHMIDDGLAQTARQAPLPTEHPQALTDPAPYFVQATLRRLQELKVDTRGGVRVFTTLIENAQEDAQQAIRHGLQTLESRYARLKKLAQKGKHLESLLLSLNLRTGGVIALVGGRGFKATQYNRALDAHRQVGSIMKPFVYLTALGSFNSDGRPYTPLTPLKDEPFTYRYENQVWSPENYDHRYRGTVPLFFALKNSLNVPTARLGIAVGLQNIIDTARRAGIESRILPMPSLALGTFELYPWEVLKAYATIARFGSRIDPYYIERVEDMHGNVLYQNEPKPEQVFAKDTTGVLVGVLRQTVLSGTGRSISSWRGFHWPAAGKTGTTSDTKDAWFVGFTPYILTVVWVGYDDNTAHGLTGSSGAIPIWTEYMKNYATVYPPTDFTYPEGTVKYFLPANQLKSLVGHIYDPAQQVGTELVFRQQNAPE